MNYRTFELPRDGGMLRGGIWGDGPKIVLASHGITGNHQTFLPLVSRLGPDYTIVAPDHRGRARSSDIAGPWSMQKHADDLIATLDHLGIARADVLLGQSMGGFVSAVAGAQHGARFGSVLMADGGIPLVDKIPWFLPAGLFLHFMLGPSMKRLGMTFTSQQSYLDYWRAHPSLKEDWSEGLEAYLIHDLAGEAPKLRSSTKKEAVIGDARSMIDSDIVPRSLREIAIPVRLLRAPRGILNGRPVYNDGHIRRWGPRIKNFSSTTVYGVNHYTLIMSNHGADAVVREIKALA